MEPVQAVMLEVPEALLAERRRLGHDRFDEMWEGVLHMVPPPRSAHQSLEAWLLLRWAPLAEPLGLQVRLETGLFDPAVSDFSSFRVPDVAVVRREHVSERGIEGRAEVVVEVRSPNDESYQKLAFYERVGVQEFVVIDEDMTLHYWTREGERLIEQPDCAQRATLKALPVTLSRTNKGGLVMESSAGIEEHDPNVL